MSLGPEHGTGCERRVKNAKTCECLKAKTRKVPLVIWPNGERKVIGEAIVDVDGDMMEMTAKITDPEYARLLYSVEGLSVSTGNKNWGE